MLTGQEVETHETQTRVAPRRHSDGGRWFPRGAERGTVDRARWRLQPARRARNLQRHSLGTRPPERLPASRRQADVTVTVDLALTPWAATVYLPLIVRNAGAQR